MTSRILRLIPRHEDVYYCPYCARGLTIDEHGIIVHDDVPHPDDWAPESERDRLQ